ncbi:MAG: DMT family transporter [Pseudomonadota bacterium]
MNTSLKLSAAQDRPVLGIGLKIASVCAFMAMVTCIKLSGQLPPGQIVFFRSFFAILPIVVWLWFAGSLQGVLKTNHLKGHIARGTIGVCAMALGFYGLTRLPLPDAIAIGYSRPLFLVVFGALFLGEVIRVYRWSAVAVGLVGVVIITWPNLDALRDGELNDREALGALATLLSACLAALAFVLVRKLIHTETTPTIVLYFSMTASGFALLSIPFGWEPLAPGQIIALVSAGFCGGLGQILLTQSYRFADTGTIAPFEYTSVILSIAIGIVLFAEYPTWAVIFGSAIVIASGVFIIWRENLRGSKAQAARPVITPQG